MYSFRHSHADGRVSYPMVFVFVTPPGDKRQEGLNVLTFGRYIISIQGVSVELSMMYAGSKNNLVK